MAQTQAGFTGSELWDKTLAARRQDDHAEQRERLRTSYLSLRQNAAVLMSEAPRDGLSFTVHDVTHVDALWETADMVCGSGTHLTPAEAYVLGCAFVLHDAAMVLAAYKEGLPAAVGEQQWRDLLSVTHFNQQGCWPTSEELDSPLGSVLDACYARAIREAHPAQAARLVDEQWRTDSGNEFFLIQDLQLRESYGPVIGELAASHWWDVNVLAERFKRGKGSLPSQPPEWIIDQLKLACILRLADAAQIDSRRAPTFLFALRRPQGESLNHWRFQEHVSRPQLHGDRITFTSLRPFTQDKAGAWWLALDYLRGVDRELKKVDALLHDLSRPRLAARAVAGVDSEERFAELFQVSGWRPIDATFQVSDVPRLVETLGGRQLYGKEPEVAVRELIQNAHDAVLARQAVDTEFTDGRVDVSLVESAGTWTLEVRDNGIGMDEDILVHGLLDFGRSGWGTDQVRLKFPGLAGSGFQPKGHFGIGFFSVFMLGDEVEVVTRRYDSAAIDARRIRFHSLGSRPILTTPQSSERPSQGTTVRAKLAVSPYDTGGIFQRAPADRLIDLIRRLVLENSVPVHVAEVTEHDEHENLLIAPFTLASGSADEIFDRLYPPLTFSWQTGREKQRLQLREEFSLRATETLDESRHRIGLATIGNHIYRRSRFFHQGLVPVNGFLADSFSSFTGFLEGTPSRASRDQVELAADVTQVAQWFQSQARRLRELGLFSPSTQLELASTFHAAFGRLEDDHCIGFFDGGLFRYRDLEGWAALHDDIFLALGWPLSWNLFSPEPFLWHYEAGVELTLPAGWLALGSMGYDSPFGDLFPESRLRDARFASARSDRRPTWQKVWWQLSGSLLGSVIRRICETWSCEIGDVLAPVAERQWDDTAPFADDSLSPASGYWLRRPHS